VQKSRGKQMGLDIDSEKHELGLLRMKTKR